MSAAALAANHRSIGADADIEFLRDPADFEKFEPDWIRLEESQSGNPAPFFQSFGWIQYVARIRAQTEKDFEPLVAVLKSAGAVKGIWPLALMRSGGARIARNLDDPFGQFAGILLAPGEDAVSFITNVIRKLKSVADGLRVEHVTVGTPLAAALFAVGANVSDRQQAVVVDLSAFPTFTDFNQATSSKVRKILRNMRNRLERECKIEHEVGPITQQSAKALDFAFTERVEWMRRNGRTSAAFQTATFSDLIHQLPSAKVQTLGFRLKAGEETASAQFGFQYGTTYYAYMSAMNPTFRDFSAGRIHLGRVIEVCYARGIRLLELMPPANRYKLEWNGQIKELETLTLALSIRGRIVFALQETMLPAARKFSRMLPEFIRRPIINVLNKN